MITSIRATSRSLADYLQSQFVLDPDLSGQFHAPGAMRVYLNSPAEMTGSRTGLSVWLYRVVRDDLTLNRPPRRVSTDLIQPPPLPLRLHYLLSPVAGAGQDDSPETEQVILGKAMQVCNDHPTLAGADLTDDFAGTDTRITTRLESLTIDQLARVWEALNISYRTSVSVEVTVVELSVDVSIQSGRPVRVPVLDAGVEVGER